MTEIIFKVMAALFGVIMIKIIARIIPSRCQMKKENLLVLTGSPNGSLTVVTYLRIAQVRTSIGCPSKVNMMFVLTCLMPNNYMLNKTIILLELDLLNISYIFFLQLT